MDEAVEAQTVVDTVRAAAGAELRERRRCSTSTAASRSERASKSLALRLEFRAADRTLTDDEVSRRSERRSATQLARELGGSLRRMSAEREPVARACVVGASGYAGALAAHLLWTHPRVSLEAVTARTRGGAPAGTISTRATACR